MLRDGADRDIVAAGDRSHAVGVGDVRGRGPDTTVAVLESGGARSRAAGGGAAGGGGPAPPGAVRGGGGVARARGKVGGAVRRLGDEPSPGLPAGAEDDEFHAGGVPATGGDEHRIPKGDG